MFVNIQTGAAAQHAQFPEKAGLKPQPWREFAVFALILMEVSWAGAWLHLVHPGMPAWLPYFLLGLPLIVSYAILRMLQFFKLRIAVQRTAGFLLFFISAAAASRELLFPESASFTDFGQRMEESFGAPVLIPAVLLVFFLYALGFARAAALAVRWVGPRVVQGSFRLGVIAWLLYFAVNPAEVGRLWLDGFVFVFAMLIASYAVRASALSVLRGGLGQRFQRRWGLPLLGSAGGMAAGTLLSGSLLALLCPLTARLVMLLLSVALTAFLLLSLPLLALVYAAAGRIMQNPAAGEVLRTVTSRLVNAFHFILGLFLDLYEFFSNLLARLPDLRWVRPALLVVLGAAVVVFFLMQIRARREGGREPVVADDELEIVRGRAAVGAGMAKALSGQWAALRGRFAGRGRTRPEARIRQIYVELLEMAAELGATRDQSQTPLEYLPVLQAAFAHADEALALITRAYVAVRYGLRQAENLREIETAWREVRTSGNDLAYAQKTHAERLSARESRTGHPEEKERDRAR
ncbi:MAG: DUF4129 domain-containing protein [Anaerolineales bacterium]|nr:DUF4129 domain-containing protein [Anaerolineales bacterium]